MSVSWQVEMKINIKDLPPGPYTHFRGCPESEGPFGVILSITDTPLIATAEEALSFPAIGVYGFLPYDRTNDGSYHRPTSFDGLLRNPEDVRKLIHDRG